MDFQIPPGSSLIASGTQATKLGNWKIVKNFSTSLKVLRRFGVKWSVEITHVELQCTPETPGLSVETEELVKSSPCENSATESRVGTEIRKAQGVCKKLALDSRAGPILTAVLKALRNFLDVITTVVISTAVYVWIRAQKLAKNTTLLGLCVFCLIIKGVNAVDQDENRKPQDSNTSETHDLAARVAVTVLILFLTVGGAGVARRMCNFWRPLQPVNYCSLDPSIAAGLRFACCISYSCFVAWTYGVFHR